MNKILNNFIDKAPLWQIYIFGWFFTGVFTALIFYGLDRLIDPPNSEILITGIKCIKMGAMSGLLFGLMFSLMVSMMRKSQIFWDYVKEVESIVEKAKTKEELDLIFNNEFQDLRKKCQGGPQSTELNRIYTIMKTKYKFV
jgi:hypothetical protein